MAVSSTGRTHSLSLFLCTLLLMIFCKEVPTSSDLKDQSPVGRASISSAANSRLAIKKYNDFLLGVYRVLL